MTKIKNLKKTADRIRKAINDKEKIILYGDADVDGTTSVIILEDSIKSLAGKVVDVYFPDREIEGHGITEIGLKFLEKHAPGLLVALDCGIGDVKEVDLAKKMGFEVIIIDHHEPLAEIPKAKIIVNPKMEKDPTVFREFSAGGLAFKVAEELLADKMTETLKRNLLELTALSTIADMVPREKENKFFIDQGVNFLKDSWRPGIKAFLEEESFKDYSTINQKIHKIISILNVRDVSNRLPASFRLFNAIDLTEAKTIVKQLLVEAEKKKQKILEIIDQVEQKIEKQTEPIIFQGGEDFELTLISSAASTLCQKYLKPVFLYKKMLKQSHGTVRSPKTIDSVCLMKKCSKLLITYGGHAQASGFRLKNDNLEKFKNCLIKNISLCEK
jgi:single-stranded-DNA-specific exonuclease